MTVDCLTTVDLGGFEITEGCQVVAGPRGSRGFPGPPGDGSVGQRMSFPTPAATWTWVHNMGIKPSIVCTITGEGVVIPDTEYPDDNTVVVQHDSPVTGYLDIS